MAPLPIPQQSDWNNNVYVLAVERTFVVIGLAFLIKILYGLVPSTWATRVASTVAGMLPLPLHHAQCMKGTESQELIGNCLPAVIAGNVQDVIELEDAALDNVPGALGTSPNFEANLTLGHPSQMRSASAASGMLPFSSSYNQQTKGEKREN